MDAEQLGGVGHVAAAVGEYPFDVLSLHPIKRRHNMRRRVCGGQPVVVEGGEDLLHRGRLGEVVDGARPHRIERRCDAAVAGEHDDPGCRVVRVELPDQREPRVAPNPQVNDRELGRLVAGEPHRLLHGRRRAGLVAPILEGPLEPAAEGLFVVHDEHGAGLCGVVHGHGSSAWATALRGKVKTTSVPPPSRPRMVRLPPVRSAKERTR